MLDIRKQQSWLPRCAMEGIFKLLLPTSIEGDYSVFVPLQLNSLLDVDVITLKKGNCKQTKLARIHLQWKELLCWCESQNCPRLFHLCMCLWVCSGVFVFLHLRKNIRKQPALLPHIVQWRGSWLSLLLPPVLLSWRNLTLRNATNQVLSTQKYIPLVKAPWLKPYRVQIPDEFFSSFQKYGWRK